MLMQRIQNFLLNQNLIETNKQEAQFELRLSSATFWVAILFSAILASILVRENRSFSMSLLEESLPVVQDVASSIYPVLIEQLNPTEPIPGQMRAYSSVTSGGRGGMTSESGFHTLSSDDTLFISLNQEAQSATDSKQTSQSNESSQKAHQFDFSTDAVNQDTLSTKHQLNQNQETTATNQTLPTRIPANYRFQDDFALRWDSSPVFAIATQELAGYKYFRDMMRQIRESFAPPGLNLAWRDQAGVVISQPIKPQIVSVLFLLDSEGNVRDVRIVSSMGQVPVDEACVKVLQHQNFGTPPPEVFKHGNIFGINFLFPRVYR